MNAFSLKSESFFTNVLLCTSRSRKWRTVDGEDREKILDREDGEFW